MTYEQIVGTLLRASVHSGEGFVITACAEFINAVQQDDPRLAAAFLECMTRHGHPKLPLSPAIVDQLSEAVAA